MRFRFYWGFIHGRRVSFILVHFNRFSFCCFCLLPRSSPLNKFSASSCVPRSGTIARGGENLPYLILVAYACYLPLSFVSRLTRSVPMFTFQSRSISNLSLPNQDFFSIFLTIIPSPSHLIIITLLFFILSQPRLITVTFPSYVTSLRWKQPVHQSASWYSSKEIPKPLVESPADVKEIGGKKDERKSKSISEYIFRSPWVFFSASSSAIARALPPACLNCVQPPT